MTSAPLSPYEAKVLPTQETRNEKVKLADLASAELNMETTLVIPPSTQLIENKKVRAALCSIDTKLSKPKLTLV